MKISVKSPVLITISIFFLTSLNAQLKLPVVNGIAADIKKVIEDYPNRFTNLIGEVKAEHPQSTDYSCTFEVNGAEESFFTRYSAKKEINSWEALILTTEDFEKAKKKYKSLFNQLNNLSIHASGMKSFHLKGKFEEPDELVKFGSVLFSPVPAGEHIKKLKVEIVMQAFEPMTWKVKVLIYDREREDEDRGAARE